MKSTVIKSLMAATCIVALSGCLQKPGSPSQFFDSMSAADDTCIGICSTKVTPEIKMYKYTLSSDKKMREVISAAALKAYWYVAMQSPNELTLTYWANDGKTLVYYVELSKEGYTLTYEDSGSMKYNEETGEIHTLYDLLFWGGGQYGLYGLVPTLESHVRKAYEEENERGEALFGELRRPKNAATPAK